MTEGCYGCDPTIEHIHRSHDGADWCECGRDWPCPYWAYERGQQDVLGLPWWRRLTKTFPKGWRGGGTG